MLGYIDKNSSVSSYQPSREVAEFTKEVKDSVSRGMEILETSWPELNNYNVIDRDSKDKRTFNAFVDEETDDPSEAWKYRGTRSEARKKGIAMHANLTASYLRGRFQAQNESDEIDREFSEYMDDVVEWMTLPTVSNYQSSFLNVGFGMLTNTVTFMGAEYYEVMQEIKVKTEKGYDKTEILDEVLSGFQAPVYSSDQILITNAYERNIQRQRCIHKRRFIEYQEAQAKWQHHSNWVYVQPGIKSIYSEEYGVFYDVVDDQHPDLVEEIVYQNRREDCEVVFINGVYFGEEEIDPVLGNPILHRDNRNAPKYNVVPFGYHRINEHFFYNKSLMNTLGWDNDLYDAMTEIVMNRAFLEQNMPVAVSGADKIDTEIIFPGAVTAFEDKDTKITPILPPANFYAGFRTLQDTKDSMAESSVSEISSGQLPDKEQKAVAIRAAAQSAKTIISGVGKNLAESVTQHSLLMADIVIQHITVPQVIELGGNKTKLKYRQFLLENKDIGGKKVSKRIIFDEALNEKEMTDEEMRAYKKEEGLKLLKKVGYPNNKEHLYIINPLLFSKMKYLSRVDIEEMFPKNDEFRQAVMSQVYPILRKEPLIDAESLVRKFTYAFFRGEADDLMSKNPKQTMQQMTGTPEKSTMGAQMESKMVSNALQGV